MKARSKPKRGLASPAACLIPQLRAKINKGSGHRLRKYYESDSPGKLFTYVSAGNIETPSVDYERETVVRRGIAPVVTVALFLVFIWLVF